MIDFWIEEIKDGKYRISENEWEDLLKFEYTISGLKLILIFIFIFYFYFIFIFYFVFVEIILFIFILYFRQQVAFFKTKHGIVLTESTNITKLENGYYLSR
jgi:hypothetical protein